MNQLKLKEYMKILAKFPVKIRCRVYEALLLKEYVRIQVTNEDDVLDWEVVLDREPNFRLYCFSTEQEAYQFCKEGCVIMMFGKPVAWLGFTAEGARALANILIEKAKSLES